MPTNCVLHELDQYLEGCKGNKSESKQQQHLSLNRAMPSKENLCEYMHADIHTN